LIYKKNYGFSRSNIVKPLPVYNIELIDDAVIADPSVLVDSRIVFA